MTGGITDEEWQIVLDAINNWDNMTRAEKRQLVRRFHPDKRLNDSAAEKITKIFNQMLKAEGALNPARGLQQFYIITGNPFAPDEWEEFNNQINNAEQIMNSGVPNDQRIQGVRRAINRMRQQININNENNIDSTMQEDRLNDLIQQHYQWRGYPSGYQPANLTTSINDAL
tara:strand:+ start:150 stop:662 length:513 start_codon:yes stop_codon:yes gene_type:complete